MNINNNYHKNNAYKQNQLHRQSQVVKCDCGCIMLYSSYWPHIKNRKHKRLMQKKVGSSKEHNNGLIMDGNINTKIISDVKIIQKYKNDKKTRKEKIKDVVKVRVKRPKMKKKIGMIQYQKKIIIKNLDDFEKYYNLENNIEKVINEPCLSINFND